MLVMMMSCSSEEPRTEQAAVSTERHDNAKAEEMIDNLPSPIEMAILVKHAGAKYNASHLNDLQALSRYQTNDKKSLNIGVYSADVGYTSLFRQKQETMFYLENLRKLSDDIGLTDAFEQSVFDRIEANLDNRDSLLSIISEAYQMANVFLKDNNRYSTAVLMIAGAWTESLSLAIDLCTEEGVNDQIAYRIAEQHASLKKLINSMSEFRDNPTIDSLYNEFVELEKVFAAKPIATMDKNENITVDENQLALLTEKSSEIRSWVIN